MRRPGWLVRGRRFVAVVTSVAMLAGCSTQAGRIGSDDGTDACRQYLVQLDSTGNFFGEDIVAGAAVGALGGALVGALATGNLRGALIGAAVGGTAGAATGYLNALQRQNRDQAALNNALANDLQRENAQLDRTQIAFGQLMDCRFKAAQQVREAYSRGMISRPAAQAQLAAMRARTQHDIQLAQTIDQRIVARGNEFDTALDTVSPGVKDSVIAARASAPVVTAAARAPVPVRLRPDPNSPEIATVPARETVRLRAAGSGFALVEMPNGQRGYAESSAFATRASRGANVPVRMSPDQQAAADSNAPAGDVRQLAASNIARRDNFTQAVQTAQAAAAGSSFELAS